MKKCLFSILALASSLAINAQTSVPTSWDCSSGNPPEGWTFVQTNAGNTNYVGASSCDATSSLRLDFDNEALVIFFGEQPGAFSYQIGGTAGGGPTAWVGIFSVDESVDGNTWVNVKTYQNSGELPLGACLNETYNFANPASRYLRFFYTDKQTGCNVRLDDISIVDPVVTAANISVNQLSTNTSVLNGGISEPFTGSTVSFDVLNDGTTEVLTVTEVNVSGPYTLTSPAVPFNVNPGSSTTLVFSFTPTEPGTNIGGVTILSNDADDASFEFELYGINGTLATQPTGEITTGTAASLKTYRLVYNFTGTLLDQDPLGGYLVLRSENGPVSAAPVDGVTYQRGQTIGNAKVVYVGRPENNSPSIRTNWVQANKTYNFATFSYAGNGSVTNYTSQINNVALTTPATQVSSAEYNAISTSSASFVTDLHNLINPHTSIFYGNYASTMINLFTVRDTFVTGAVTFDKVLNCVYSGETKLYNNPFDWTANGYSREHTYAHSWMPSFDASDPEEPEYNDQHNLYPARQVNVNDLRCNYPFGEVVTVETGWPVNNPQGLLGLDANGNRVYEPKEEHKGRVARSLMYMAVCYTEGANVFSFNRPNGLQCSAFQIDYPQNQYLMKQWHFEHPPTGWDIARNDFLDSLQNNRNPFVDQPDYACFIDFSDVSKIETPSTPCWLDETGFETINNMNLTIYPNPSQGNIRVSWAGVSDQLSMNVYDVSGKVIDTRKINATNGVNIQDIQFNLPAGIYLLKLNGTKSSAIQKLIISE
jgi:endonuclease I